MGVFFSCIDSYAPCLAIIKSQGHGAVSGASLKRPLDVKPLPFLCLLIAVTWPGLFRGDTGRPSSIIY